MTLGGGIAAGFWVVFCWLWLCEMFGGFRVMLRNEGMEGGVREGRAVLGVWS